MHKFKRIVSFLLILILLCSSALAAPLLHFNSYSDTGAMQYLQAERLAAYLCTYHFDSGVNDQPLLRAYQTLFKTKETVSAYRLRNDLIEYFEKDEDNFSLFAFVMCQMYDPHTMLMTTEEYAAAFPDHVNYEGLGITVLPFGSSILVVSVYENSPAAKAGIEPNDRIVKVGSSDLRLGTYEESLAIFSSAVKEKFMFSVLKYDTGELQEISIVAEEIIVPNISYTVLNNEIGYLLVTQFGGSDFSDLLNEAEIFFHENNVKKILLDLRDNPGGDLTKLLEMINFFIPQKDVPLFSIVTRSDPITYFSDGTGTAYEKTAILVNASSASSSEICAGVLSDLGYAAVIGTSTYGKAKGQSTYVFDERYLLHMTVTEVSLPQRGAYHDTGITPDIESNQLKLYPYDEELHSLKEHKAISADSSNEAIALLQESLHILGYLGSYSPGEFDTATLDALHSIQSALQLNKTDICSFDLLKIINNSLEIYAEAYFIIDAQYADALNYLSHE